MPPLSSARTRFCDSPAEPISGPAAAVAGYSDTKAGMEPGPRKGPRNMNLAWGEGVVDGLGGSRLNARLDRAPGRCCVLFDEDR